MSGIPLTHLRMSCSSCAAVWDVPAVPGGAPTAACPQCAVPVAVPELIMPPQPEVAFAGEERLRNPKVRAPAMPGSRPGRTDGREPPRLPKPGGASPAPVPPAKPTLLPKPPSPALVPAVLNTPAVAAAEVPAKPAAFPFPVPANPNVLPPPPATAGFVDVGEMAPAPACTAGSAGESGGLRKKTAFRRRVAIYIPLTAAALLCSAAVAAWRVWPAALYFTDLSEPDNEILYHYQPAAEPAAPLIAPPATQGGNLFEEFAAEGFHFRPPVDYWERLPNAGSPFSLLRPAFTLRRTESSPPSEFGIGACDFAISIDVLPAGTGVDDVWQNLPSVVALQARFSCGLPERYEINTSSPQSGRFLRLVWDELPALSGEPARQLEMWVQQRGRIAWSLTGLMPGSASSYALTRTMQRLTRGFSPLETDPEVIRLAFASRDLTGATPLISPPAAEPLHRWTALPPGTSTWPGGQWQVPGADTVWAVGQARIALITVPPDGLEKVPPSRILTGLRQIWPALRGFSFPVIDPADSPDGKTLRLAVDGHYEGQAAQCALRWHRSARGTVVALVLQPDAGEGAAPDPAGLLADLDLTPQLLDPAAPPAPLSAVHLPLLEVLASEAQADGRPRESSAILLALFARSQRLEDLAAACGSLAAAGQMEEAIRLFEMGGERFTHTTGWELYRTLVLARLGAGPRAHRYAMDLLSSRRFPGSLALPYLNALIDSRSWPQARTFASMLVRNDPDSAQWRLQYATILTETGERAKGIAIIKATQQTWPDDAMLGIECVRILLRYKCLQDAVGVAGRVALAHADHEQAQLVFGQCQTLLGRNEEARMAYQRALKAAPSSQAARQALASLAAISAQSDTAFVTTAIDPVALPAALCSGLPLPPTECHTTALMLSRITGLRQQRGRLPATTVRTRILIGNAEGMSQWNTLTFPLDPARERLALHYLNVLAPSGKIIDRGNPADRYTLDSPDGSRLVHFPVPGLVPGCIIDYAATTEGLTPAASWSYTRHAFALAVPCLADICYVTGDTTSLTWVHSRNQEPIRSGEALIWREDQPPSLTTAAGVIPTLHLGTVTASWESTGRDYLEQIRHRLTPDPAIKEAAARCTAGLAGRSEKIAALARLVRADISYTAIEFGYRAIIPHAAAVTLQNRFGDCKDHAVLLHGLLAASGIPSHLALIHSTVPTHPGFPALSQFDHMIVALPVSGGGFDFIDATDKFLEPAAGCAPTGLTSRQALILDPANPRLVTTPATEVPSAATLVRLVSIQNERDALITDDLTLTGPAAANLRSLLAPLPPSGHLPVLRRLLGLDRLREQLLSTSFTALRDPSAPLTARLTWKTREALRPAPNGLHLFLSTPLADYLLFPAALSEPAPSGPVVITAPIKLDTTLQIQVPLGFALFPPPLHRPSGERSAGTWTTQIRDTTLIWSARLNAGTWTGPEAAAACSFPAEALQPLRQPWLLSGRDFPPRPPRDFPPMPVFGGKRPPPHGKFPPPD